ncbi:hypothetical protein MKK84_02435, partial [Methylobacterium sp. E-065]|uniref:hypothetical protein n=1 Tax=Methylobacterium sp. E-065 TaxID=2836583 RepID=UPI001FBBD17C
MRTTARHRPGRVRRVSVLGAISPTTGGLVLQALATDAQTRNLPLRFALLGFCHPALDGGFERSGLTRPG